MDKKYLIILVLAICIIGAIIVLKETTSEEVRDKTVNAMGDVKAYKYIMTVDTVADKIVIDGEMDLKNKKARSKISMTSEGMIIPIEIYVIDDVSYLKMFGQWTKKTLTGAFDDDDHIKNQMEIIKFSNAILIKNESFYVLEVVPNEEKLLAYTEKQTQMESDFKDIKTNMTVWINKTDNLVKKTEIKITNYNINITITLEISAYPQQLDIKLPGEAETANWASEGVSENETASLGLSENETYT